MSSSPLAAKRFDWPEPPEDAPTMTTASTTDHRISGEPVTAPPSDPKNPLRSAVKGTASAIAVVLAALPAATCWIEALVTDRSELFRFWAQVLALAPGLPGRFLRRGFYYLTLQKCPLSCDIGFMSYFNDRRSEVGAGAYVGFGVALGLVSIGEGCLIGNRVSLLNGGQQHELGPDGRLTAFDWSKAQRVYLGEQTWIGEGAILMADVGRYCVVGAGSVVSQPLPDGSIVTGNPMRLVRKQVVPCAKNLQEGS